MYSPSFALYELFLFKRLKMTLKGLNPNHLKADRYDNIEFIFGKSYFRFVSRNGTSAEMLQTEHCEDEHSKF